MTKTNRTTNTNNTAFFRTYESGKRFLLPTGCGVEMGDRVTFSFIRGVDKATGKPFTFVKFIKSTTGHKVGMRGNRLLVQTGRHGIPGFASASLIYRAEFGGWLVEDGQQPTANAAAHTPITKVAANFNAKLAPLPRNRSLVAYGGKKPGFKKFLTNLLNELEAEGFIGKGYAAHRHREIAFRSDWQ